MNLERAFSGLRYGLELTVREKGESALLGNCRDLVEQAYAEYHAGRNHEGRSKLEAMEKLLKEMPSQ